jgi:hypothetical protein
MPKRTQPSIKVITQKPAARTAEPPCKLGEVGMSLWTDIVQVL